jgi:trans-aconitate methyltransferase
VVGERVIADLGCGPRHVAIRLSDRVPTAVGIDLSAGMVEAGHRRFPAVWSRRGDLPDL